MLKKRKRKRKNICTKYKVTLNKIKVLNLLSSLICIVVMCSKLHGFFRSRLFFYYEHVFGYRITRCYRRQIYLRVAATVSLDQLNVPSSGGTIFEILLFACQLCMLMFCIAVFISLYKRRCIYRFVIIGSIDRQSSAYFDKLQ